VIALLKSVLGQSRIYGTKGSVVGRSLGKFLVISQSPWPTSGTVIGGLLFYLLFSTMHLPFVNFD